MSRFDDDEFTLQFLDDAAPISSADMLAQSGLQLEELIDLVEQGAFGLELTGTVVEEWRFVGRYAHLARRAVSLRQSFELDSNATSLLIGLLERIDELQRRVRDLECRLIGDD